MFILLTLFTFYGIWNPFVATQYSLYHYNQHQYVRSYGWTQDSQTVYFRANLPAVQSYKLDIQTGKITRTESILYWEDLYAGNSLVDAEIRQKAEQVYTPLLSETRKLNQLAFNPDQKMAVVILSEPFISEGITRDYFYVIDIESQQVTLELDRKNLIEATPIKIGG